VRRGLWPGVVLGLLLTVGPMAFRLFAAPDMPDLAEKKDEKKEEKKEEKEAHPGPRATPPWMLVSSGPGAAHGCRALALFYGGMVRRKETSWAR